MYMCKFFYIAETYTQYQIIASKIVLYILASKKKWTKILSLTMDTFNLEVFHIDDQAF
jgi:hypothetical protein